MFLSNKKHINIYFILRICCEDTVYDIKGLKWSCLAGIIFYQTCQGKIWEFTGEKDLLFLILIQTVWKMADKQAEDLFSYPTIFYADAWCQAFIKYIKPE